MSEHDDALRVLLDNLPVAEINPGKTYDMGRAALFYAVKVGWPVLPIHHPVPKATEPFGLDCSCSKAARPCGYTPGKHPIGELVPNGLKNATTDPAVIADWWRRWPHANIAVRTGYREAGGIGFDVLDLDGEIGQQSWRDAAIEVPVIYESFTPGNRDHTPGRHLYVPACGTGNKANELPGVDTRGDDGYVLVPPSRGMRGTRYSWVVAPA